VEAISAVPARPRTRLVSAVLACNPNGNLRLPSAHRDDFLDRLACLSRSRTAGARWAGSSGA
jgi:hypothetical protein